MSDRQTIAQAERPCKPAARPGLNPKGWARLPNALLLHPRFRELKSSSHAVLWIIAAHWNKGSGLAYPSRQTIADLGGMSLGTVKRCLAELAEFGFLTWESAEGKGRKRHNLYQIPLMDASNGCASDPIQSPAMGAPARRNGCASAPGMGAPARREHPNEQTKEQGAANATRAERRRRCRFDRYAAVISFARDDERAVIQGRYRTVDALAADDPLSDDELFGAPADALDAILARLKPPETSDSAGDPSAPESAQPQVSERVPA